MGGFQTEQPVFGKEQIRPALVVTTATAKVDASAENAPQAASDVAIEVREDVRIRAVLEVLEPTSQRWVQLRDHALQRFAAVTASLLADGVLEFLEALLAGPVVLTSKFIAQKRSAALPQPKLSAISSQLSARKHFSSS